MAKPICLITIDGKIADGLGNDPWRLCRSLRESYESQMPDYYMFVIPEFNMEEPIPAMRIQVFYERDFTEVQYNELREIIENSIKPTDQQPENK